MYKHEAKFYHGLISLVSTAVMIFIGVVVCGAEPQIPLIFSCTIAALVALWLGHSWEEILEGDPLLISLTADERALRYITELGNRLES